MEALLLMSWVTSAWRACPHPPAGPPPRPGCFHPAASEGRVEAVGPWWAATA